MRRKGAGVGAINKERLVKEKYKTKGDELASDRIKKLTKSMEVLKDHLQKFAAQHGQEIREDPEFRKAFHAMCASIGVDPLGSYSLANKSLFGQIFGHNLSNFYNELAVQVIEVCLATRHRNGGIIPLNTLTQLVVKSRGPYLPRINDDDVSKTVAIIGKYLGNGFRVLKLPALKAQSNINVKQQKIKDDTDQLFVQCVPADLTIDHLTLMRVVEDKVIAEQPLSEKPNASKETKNRVKEITQKFNMSAKATFKELIDATSWEPERVKIGIDYLIKEGLVWMDEQNFQEIDGQKQNVTLYWFFNFFENS